MRGIVLSISLLLLAVGCGRDNDYMQPSSCSVVSLWSYVRNSTVVIPDDIYIDGYIVANDRFGELDNCVVVADSSGGVAISADAECIEDILPLYSRVKLHCSGLWIANQDIKLLLGAKPTGEYLVDKVTQRALLNYIRPVPDNDSTPIVNHRTIATLKDRDMLTLITISGIHLVEEEHGLLWADIDEESGIARTSLRHFTDGCDTLSIVISSSCHYAREAIPTTSVRLSGILDNYAGDKVLRVINHGVDIM